MNTKLIALALIAGLTLPAAAQARVTRAELRHDVHQVREEKRDLKEERRELKRAKGELRRDSHRFHHQRRH
ncbi:MULTISPECIES: hypothetical protein [unclassified Novosphingobium]|uniref:hypothetical protein n=1 Tax=unclassified Novosphingobium TaxID=2644732 RepID=UPI000EDD28EB|nr:MULTISPECIES: hypothetical protein [unclassified Novosphingobium]HCF24353.1 hypothetical protein [Novosphingobium sp.]HQV02626.1 hypothetical protein [Novosphingobium sp.]